MTLSKWNIWISPLYVINFTTRTCPPGTCLYFLLTILYDLAKYPVQFETCCCFIAECVDQAKWAHGGHSCFGGLRAGRKNSPSWVSRLPQRSPRLGQCSDGSRGGSGNYMSSLGAESGQARNSSVRDFPVGRFSNDESNSPNWRIWKTFRYIFNCRLEVGIFCSGCQKDNQITLSWVFTYIWPFMWKRQTYLWKEIAPNVV